MAKRRRWPRKRPDIAFLTASIHTGAGFDVLKGVLDAVEETQVNLFCFPGGRLSAPGIHETKRNDVFDVLPEISPDGILSWASALGGFVDLAGLEAFHGRFSNLPLVSLSQKMGLAPVVKLDGYRGMDTILSHLIEVHGHRRIAFVRGPENHASSHDRYRAYRDCLVRHGIEVVDELITQPMGWDEGTRAAEVFLNERKLIPGQDFEAVAAASDLLAFWVVRGFQARGYQVPADVAVCGFNDSKEGRLAAPPLTTVVMPFDAQGAAGIEMLVEMLESGRHVPDRILPVDLVVRQSCGCLSAEVAMAASASAGDEVPSDTDARVRAVSAALQASPEEENAWVRLSVQAFETEIGNRVPGIFLPTLEKILERVVRVGQDPILWHRAVSELRRSVVSTLSGRDLSAAEDLFGQARVLIGEAVQRGRTYRLWEEEQRNNRLRELGQKLLMTFDTGLLFDLLCEELPLLGIPSAFLVLNRNETRNLCMAYTEQGRFSIGPEGLSIDMGDIKTYLPGRRYSFIVEPLFFQDENLGFILLEVGPVDGSVYEELRGYIASALKGALLFLWAEEARFQAERADRIKSRLLAYVSHELRTPLTLILESMQVLERWGHGGPNRDTALQSGASVPGSGNPSTDEYMARIRSVQSNARHQIQVVNDLLDLSRTEIGEIDLDVTMIDPAALLTEAFDSFSAGRRFEAAERGLSAVNWVLDLPPRLPLIRGDPLRLRQMLFNLLSNADKFTREGEIRLAASVDGDRLHIRVGDSGPGIPASRGELVFEPFFSEGAPESGAGNAGTGKDTRNRRGVGLGLAISRSMVKLHGGTIELESEEGKGCVFHIYLPLPMLDPVGGDSRSGISISESGELRGDLLVIGRSRDMSDALRRFYDHQGLTVTFIRSGPEGLPSGATGGEIDVPPEIAPRYIAWDLAEAQEEDFALLRSLRSRRKWGGVPLLLYGGDEPSLGITGFLLKETEPGSSGEALLHLVDSGMNGESRGTITIIDDDESANRKATELLRRHFPGREIVSCFSGEEAMDRMKAQTPALVLLDYVMPGMSGADVLDAMRSQVGLRSVPVIVLTNKILGDEDLRRIEYHSRVLVQSKGIWTDDEVLSMLSRVLGEEEPFNPGSIVKRALAWMTRHYGRPFSRWQLAEAVNVSEDHLSRAFHRDLGISPWDFLTRYRIHQAKDLLEGCSETIGTIAFRTGFSDPAYFCRVFKKITGTSPQTYRDGIPRASLPE